MVLVEEQYKDIRRKLDEMGYHEPCSTESLLLVEKLFNDLLRTHDKLLMYEDLAKSTLTKCETLETALVEVKQENKHLVKENNKMHLEAIQFKEDSEERIKQLKMRISDLENSYSDLEFNYMEQMTSLGVLRQELLEKNHKLYDAGIDTDIVEDSHSKDNRCFLRDNSFVNNGMSNEKEVENYKKKHRQLLDEIEMLNNRLFLRDEEIARLGHQLEEHNAYSESNIKKTCRCHHEKFELTEDIMTPVEMHDKVNAAQEKQHEAMQRAIYLADQIRELESEIIRLKSRCDYSQECICGKNITFLQKQHNETLNKIKDMEVRMTNLQTLIANLTKEKSVADERAVYLGKEKDKLNDELREVKIIERDLRTEIEKLQQSNAKLRNEVLALEKRDKRSLDLVSKQTSPVYADEDTTKLENVSRCGCDYEAKSEEIKAERDYYCNELHRLQEKVYNAERIHDFRCCNRTDRLSDFTLLKKMQTDMNIAREENKRLQEEVVCLRNQMKEFSNYKQDSNKLVENHIKKLEYDKGTLTSVNSDLKSKLQSTEDKIHEFAEKISFLTQELNNYKVKYNHLKKINLHLDLSLKNNEAAAKQTELDLNQSMARLHVLEKELKSTREEIILLKKEKQEVRENLLRLDSEKDELLLKIDDKTIIISKLDRELQGKNSQIAQIDNKKCKLQAQLQTVEKMLHVAEDKSKDYAKKNRKLEQEILSMQSCNEDLSRENQTLKRELAAVSQDNLSLSQALEKSRNESENLKRELQTYVDEVRRVENILLEKEREREALLEQFNALSVEASHLGSNKQSLECEANLARDNLRDTQHKLSLLQKDASAKDSIVSGMESQIRQLTDQILQLQAKVSEMSDRELMLASDLDAARHLCSTLEEQKQYYGNQISEMTNSEQILREELDRIACENEALHNQLCQEQKSSYTLENLLANTRHEAMEKSLYNEDLTGEMKKMKHTVIALESKLNSVTSALSDCQSACAEYHTQNTHLRRTLVVH
uniref:Uncharacterized protein n=1 Tax=Rhodnius prolixus TaxID=13249 RepID=T1HA73_RHOPR